MKERELTLIKQAILNEIEGYEFYKMAAGQTKSIESKNALLALADEEFKHSTYLKELFNKIKKQGDDFQLAFLSDIPSPGIYRFSDIKDNANLSLAVTIFSIGMEMEKASIKFYEKAFEETELPEAKKLYEILIAWEKTHLEQFQTEYTKHRQEWWSEQSFAPF
ncbi:ferritin family protein [Gottschalkiaceae bacterium SANA]|nr:ferritin family protein [Gottschalkiaceae bacterium SANA]